MLRLIRKFQLIILAVGGSLLMVVFLFQPVLTQLAPSPLKTKVAQLDDGTTYTRMDIQRANVAISLLKRVNPRALGPRSAGGIGLDPTSESNTALHWLLLAKQAEAAGFVGEAGYGVSWINELALQEAAFQVAPEARNQATLEFQQGLITSQADFFRRYQALTMQRATELAPQYEQMMLTNASRSAGNAGGTMEDVYKILAQARGIYHLLASFQSMPAYSDLHAIYAAHETLDAVAINAAVLDSSLATDAVAEPTQEQLQAFFDTYKAQSPADNDFNIGYTQPTRIQLGWLMLEKNVFMNTVKVDRVELNKIWRQDRTLYPEDFASERFALERQYRDTIATDMMIEADRLIRAQVLAATTGLPKSDGILTLPADWDSKSPRLDDIAGIIVERISEQFSVNLPTPSVTMIGDRWLNANAIASLPEYGASTYRIGSRQLPVYSLPQFFELTEPNTTGLDVQVMLPLVDPASTDEIGNRFYSVVLAVRAQGPADTIADVTREQVVADYKSVEAFKLLSARIREFESAITSGSALAPAIDLATAMSIDQDAISRPGVLRNILVMRDSIAPGALANFVIPSSTPSCSVRQSLSPPRGSIRLRASMKSLRARSRSSSSFLSRDR
ncbi:MAG: hypothetical protein JKX68_11920, partial [Flavobacteriales bacterium]|nr:hypothetical protein [Flavobacteriales bacterium]